MSSERKQQEQAQRQRERELEIEAKQREREGEMRRDHGEDERDYERGGGRGERRERDEEERDRGRAPPQRSSEAYRPPTMRERSDRTRYVRTFYKITSQSHDWSTFGWRLRRAAWRVETDFYFLLDRQRTNGALSVTTGKVLGDRILVAASPAGVSGRRNAKANGCRPVSEGANSRRRRKEVGARTPRGCAWYVMMRIAHETRLETKRTGRAPIATTASVRCVVMRTRGLAVANATTPIASRLIAVHLAMRSGAVAGTNVGRSETRSDRAAVGGAAGRRVVGTLIGTSVTAAATGIETATGEATEVARAAAMSGDVTTTSHSVATSRATILHCVATSLARTCAATVRRATSHRAITTTGATTGSTARGLRPTTTGPARAEAAARRATHTATETIALRLLLLVASTTTRVRIATVKPATCSAMTVADPPLAAPRLHTRSTAAATTRM